jgi:murein DD-endopeptidase MepM/ murein hydrolase activator NlpD
MKSIFLFIFFLFFSFYNSSSAETSCAEDMGTVCVLTEQSDNSIIFYVDNQNTYDITITIDVNMNNMKADVKLPYTESFEGNKKEKVFTLQAGKSGRWSYRYNFHWTPGTTLAHHDNSYIYTLPFESGTSHTVIQGYNGKFSHYGDFKNAIDFEMPVGTNILSARDGIVVGVRDNLSGSGTSEEYKNRSNYIMIKHDDGTIASYDHIQRGGAKVELGQSVSAGDLIALSGNVGYSTTPHLHFFVFKAVNGYDRKSFKIKFKSLSSTPYTIIEGEEYTAP